MTDEQLVMLCKQGEESAYELLIQRYHQQLYNFILGYTGEVHLAEDIVQETFIKMINNIDKFKYKESAKFSTWLFTIARNTITDEFRKRKIRETVSIEDDDAASPDSVEAKIIHNDTVSNLNHAIGALPHDLKSIILLRYYMDFSYKEISTIISSTPEKVKWRLHYAVEKIRKMLKLKGVNMDET